jgi:hypothetical protein
MFKDIFRHLCTFINVLIKLLSFNTFLQSRKLIMNEPLRKETTSDETENLHRFKFQQLRSP